MGRYLLQISTFFLLTALALPLWAQDLGIDFPALDRPAAQTDQGQNDLAIIVAVENYHNLSGIPGAAVSAMDWRVFFAEHLGIPEERILTLQDHRATPARMRRDIPAHLENANPEGRVWFVFIGHGAPYQGVENGEQVSDGLLVGVGAFNDTYEDFIDGSLRQSELEAMLGASDQEQTIMILDACFSGRTPFDQNLTGTQAVIPSAIVPSMGARDIIFSAAEYSEVANLLPGASVQRPAFSYLLMGALRGWADRNGDGTVTLAEAETFVQRGLLGLQTPTAFVTDRTLRDTVLVGQAPEADPGVSRRIQSILSRGRDIAGLGACERPGQVRNIDTQGQCCWPGQAYSSSYGSCVGTPMCPDQMTLGDDGECRQATDEEESYARVVNRDDCTSGRRCAQIADDAYFGRGGAHDFERAATYYERACQMGGDDGLRACAQLGYMIQYSQGGLQHDEGRALELYQRSCTDEVAWGCAGLGFYHGNGLGGLTVDTNRAVELHRRGCEAGSMRGCGNLGHYYSHGRGGLTQDQERARSLFERACEQGEPVGCDNLGIYYRDGTTVTRDYGRAAELFESACDRGDAPACTNLGHLHENGNGVAQSYFMAAQLYEKGCTGGNALGCTNLGFLYRRGTGVSANDVRARALYEQGCNGGNMQGCHNLGVLYERGIGGSANRTTARRYFQQACDGGRAESCSDARRLW